MEEIMTKGKAQHRHHARQQYDNEAVKSRQNLALPSANIIRVVSYSKCKTVLGPNNY